ncbi:LOW QUALITY PROTEIN: beta-1,4 N-acetylgalactosaminyltransferase 1-like [Saccoglossus kowalevskii]
MRISQAFSGIICFALGAAMSTLILLNVSRDMCTLQPRSEYDIRRVDDIAAIRGFPPSSFDLTIDDIAVNEAVDDIDDVFPENNEPIDSELGIANETAALMNNNEDNITASVIQRWNERQNVGASDTESKLRNKLRLDDKICECHRILKHPLDDDIDERRQQEALLWLQEERENREPLAICKSLSPLSYIGSGIEVEPLQAVRLAGMSLDPTVTQLLHQYGTDIFSVRLKTVNNVAVLFISRTTKIDRLLTRFGGVDVTGNGTTELTISSVNLKKINTLLHQVIYKSTFYDISIRDTVLVTFMEFTIEVHVHVKRQTMPDLYDLGPSPSISDKVTVITKTFERYDAVNRLVKSIKTFYPRLPIIVADDSEFPQRIVGRNVKQTLMPFAEGFFAGRGVALSQVATKYFLWVDDDFVFTEKTKLEIMLEKLEDPISRIDIVGGMVRGRAYNKCYTFNMADNQATASEHFTEVTDHTTGIPNVTSPTLLSTVRNVGFDPEYRRIGHSEFFIDGLGKLRVISCKDVDVDHVQVRNPKYSKYRMRTIDTTDAKRHTNHLFFNNNLKCT